MLRAASGSLRPLVWLALGCAVGLGVAGWGLLSARSDEGLPPDALASVNGVPIYSDELETLLAGMAREGRAEPDAKARRHVLRRLVDEELLVQRGLELGLVASDRRVRSALVDAVVRSVVVEAEDREPAPEELRAFYAEEQAFFARPERLHLRQLFVRQPSGQAGSTSPARAAQASQRLRAGKSLLTVRAELGDTPVAPLPDGPLPLRSLRAYLGPAALEAARALEPGEVSDPVASPAGLHVLQLVAREPAGTPPLAAIEEQVRAEWRRRLGEAALRDYLEGLRERAELHFAPEAL